MRDCTTCSNPISAKRLIAIPYAQLCISCASAAELNLEGNSIEPNCRNMERLGNIMIPSDDSYAVRRTNRTRFITGGISQAMELGI